MHACICMYVSYRIASYRIVSHSIVSYRIAFSSAQVWYRIVFSSAQVWYSDTPHARVLCMLLENNVHMLYQIWPGHSCNMQCALLPESVRSHHTERSARPSHDSKWEWRGMVLQQKSIINKINNHYNHDKITNENDFGRQNSCVIKWYTHCGWKTCVANKRLIK